MRIVSLFLILSIIAYSNLSLAQQPIVTRAAGMVSPSFGMNPCAATPPPCGFFYDWWESWPKIASGVLDLSVHYREIKHSKFGENDLSSARLTRYFVGFKLSYPFNLSLAP